MAASLQLLEEYFVTLNVEDDEYEYESCAPSLRRQDSGKRRRLNQPQAPFTPLRRSSLDNSLRQCQQRSKSLEHFYSEVMGSGAGSSGKQRRRSSLDSTIHLMKKQQQHQPSSLFVDKNATWNNDNDIDTTMNNSNRSITSPTRPSSSKNIVDPFDTSSRFRGILQDSMYTSSESCSRSIIKKGGEGREGGSS